MAFETDVENLLTDMFEEPVGYFPPEPSATYVKYTLLCGQTIQLRLVGHNPLWVPKYCKPLRRTSQTCSCAHAPQGHYLWNAGQVISKYLQQYEQGNVRDKYVLELGAGAGLPSLVAAILGARRVVVTDYPDADLIANLNHNIANIAAPKDPTAIIRARGYLWGQPAETLLAELPDRPTSSTIGVSPRFDFLILADLLFNHSEHIALLSTISFTLNRSSDAKALIFFTPYRPWLLEKDMAFFKLAVEAGFTVEKIWEEVMEKVMFEKDIGDELLRRTVFGYELRWEERKLETN